MKDEEQSTVDETPQKQRHWLLRWSPIQGLVLLFVVVSGFVFISSSLWDVDFLLIGGPKKLMVQDNRLRLLLRPQVKELEVYFTENFESPKQPVLSNPEESGKPLTTEAYIAEIIDKKTVRARITKPDSLQGETSLLVWFSESGRADIPTRRYINKVRLNGQEISITDFYKNFLITGPNGSNVTHYKSWDIWNLSNTTALSFGETLLWQVTFILVVMLLAQLFLVVLSFKLAPQLNPQRGEAAQFPMNWIDGFAERYSLLFGFLGTILSIWVSLERADTAYGDFFHLLTLIRYAVFTTVLGLVTRVAYAVRVYLSGRVDKGANK